MKHSTPSTLFRKRLNKGSRHFALIFRKLKPCKKSTF
jgi:hypothetical protein